MDVSYTDSNKAFDATSHGILVPNWININFKVSENLPRQTDFNTCGCGQRFKI